MLSKLFSYLASYSTLVCLIFSESPRTMIEIVDEIKAAIGNVWGRWTSYYARHVFVFVHKCWKAHFVKQPYWIQRFRTTHPHQHGACSSGPNAYITRVSFFIYAGIFSPCANVCVYVNRTRCSRKILSYRLRCGVPGGHTRISLGGLVRTWNTCLGRLRELPSTWGLFRRIAAL